ncbi:MAG: DUF58 domain-containing protein [Dehalococcoidia bacterium]|nr:DUF58 domain-containing protein [Dehalococcoidia bacterium]
MRSLVAILLLVVALVLGFVTGFSLFFRLAYVLVILLALSRVWSLINLRGIEVIREAHLLRAQVGQVVEEKFEVRNTTPIGKPWVEVRDYSDLPEHHASLAFSLGTRQTRRWQVKTICQQRGKFTLGPIAISSSDPFGFFQGHRLMKDTKTLLVYPSTVELPGFEIPGGELPGEGRLHDRTHQMTPVASRIRDYQPGDAYNRIHWPSSARTGKLQVKEFELDPSSDVWILLDMHQEAQAGQGQDSTEEYAVTIAASLAKHFLGASRSLGLIAFGEHHEVVPSDRGGRQQLKIFESLAVVRATGHIPLGEIIAAESFRFGRNSTVIVVTPSTKEDWVQGLQQLVNRGVRGVAVVLDPTTFGGPDSPILAVGLLAAAGIPSYVIRRGESIRETLLFGKGGMGR